MLGKNQKLRRREAGTRANPVKFGQRLRLEPLEDRRLLALLGIVPTNFIAYDSTGTVDYTSGTLSFSTDATPLTFKETPISPTRNVTGVRDFRINIQVDNAGNLVGGVAGNDLIVTGDIDINGDSVIDVSGVLLTGEVSQFGYLNAASGTTDTFDFRFTPTGGQLMNYFVGKDIGVRTSSENSNFTNFTTNFHGGAKGNLAPINALTSSLAGNVYIDANNNGQFETGLGEVGLEDVEVTLTGTTVDGAAVNLTTTTDVNGAYSFTGLRAGTYTITETQPAGYNDGMDTQGTPGNGTTGNDVFSNIFLGSGVNGVNNNFGERLFITMPASSLSGYVYVDADNDGFFDLGELPISGVTVTLTGTDDQGPVNLVTMTGVNGAYSFPDLRPGTYTITESQPASYLDGKDTAGSQGGTAGNDVITDIVLAAGVDGVNNNFGELESSTLSGFVYYDVNQNGDIDIIDQAIANATVTLTGTDDLGNPVNIVVQTDADGFYLFQNLRPGTYTITETQPAGFADGQDDIGTQGGTAGNDVFSNIVLTSGTHGINNNFGEVQQAGGELHGGQTATIGFWHNKNGQALIKSLNGGATSTALGNWLATMFPEIYGPTAGVNNMTGKTNTQVAAYFQTLFNQKGQKLQAQVLATAFAVYSTNTTLAGSTVAQNYGFIVDTSGTGSATYNVGTNGAALGVADYSILTIMEILLRTNDRANDGLLWDVDDSGTISSFEQALRNMGNEIFTGINEAGDIP